MPLPAAFGLGLPLTARAFRHGMLYELSRLGPMRVEGVFDMQQGIGRKLARLVAANKRIVILAVCAIVFVALLEDVLEGELGRIDTAAYAVIVERLRADWLTPIMEAISALATPVSLIVLLLVVVAFAPGKRPGACAAVNLVLVFVLNQTLKFIVQRPRPDGFQLAVEQGFSFPSGHSMVAMAFFGLLVWMVWHYESDRATRIGCSIAFGLVIVLVGMSRVYLGVHYASDVLAGFCVSLAWLAIYTRVAAPLFLGPGPRHGASSGDEGDRSA